MVDRTKGRVPGSLIWLIVGLAAGGLALAGVAGASAPPQPTYGTAVVDGDPGEWNEGDFFGDLFSPGESVEAKLYLRYDCSLAQVYAMVQVEPGVELRTDDPNEVYVRLDSQPKLVHGNSGNDGRPPDFAWSGQSGAIATGFEASASLPEGDYTGLLRVHAKVLDSSSDGYHTIDLVPRFSDLVIDCPSPPATVVTTSTTTTSTTILPQVTTTTTAPPATTTTMAPPTIESTTTTTAPVVLGVQELPRTGTSGMRTLLLLGLTMTLTGLALLGGGAGKGRLRMR